VVSFTPRLTNISSYHRIFLGNFLSSWATLSFSRRTPVHYLLRWIFSYSVMSHYCFVIYKFICVFTRARYNGPSWATSVRFIFITHFLKILIICVYIKFILFLICLICVCVCVCVCIYIYIYMFKYKNCQFHHYEDRGFHIPLLPCVTQSVYRWATVWTIGVLGFDFRRGLGIFLFTTAFRTALGPTQPPIQWVTGALYLGVKRPGREADHSHPSSAEVKECVELYLHSPSTPSWRAA
jgi:hypothetical protein